MKVGSYMQVFTVVLRHKTYNCACAEAIPSLLIVLCLLTEAS